LFLTILISLVNITQSKNSS